MHVNALGSRTGHANLPCWDRFQSLRVGSLDSLSYCYICSAPEEDACLEIFVRLNQIHGRNVRTEHHLEFVEVVFFHMGHAARLYQYKSRFCPSSAIDEETMLICSWITTTVLPNLILMVCIQLRICIFLVLILFPMPLWTHFKALAGNI